MKYLNKKELEEAETKYDYAPMLKNKIITNDEMEIRLWLAESLTIIAGRYLVSPSEEGYAIEVIMGGCGQIVKLPGKTLVEACEAFNTILQTMKA